MFKRWIFLLISATILVALYGCHAGGHAPFINSFDTQVVERSAIVRDGSFPDISFPSGAVIRCTTDNILKDDVKITASEEKVFLEYDYETRAPLYYYLYKISAVLPSANALDGDAVVNTIEQPISITLPNNISDTGNCFVGLRANENEPWLYSLINDSNANIASLRLAKRADKTCSFNLFRLGQQFRLFVFDSFKENEAIVTSVTSFTDDKITIKDDKYAEDLNLKVKINGEKLDQIKVDSLKARITYRSDNLSPVQLKANGSIVSQIDSSDKAVSGSYAHSFVVSNIKVESQMSGEAVLSLVLNLKDIKLADFPTKFLIEFYSDGKAENTLPFIYTEAFSFETKEQQDDPEPQPTIAYSIEYELNGGNLAEGVTNPSSYNEDSDTIILNNPDKKGYTFTGWSESDSDTPQNPMSIVQGSKGDKKFIANYSIVNYALTYTNIENCTFATTNPSNYTFETEDITLCDPTKEGYTFLGWTSSEITVPLTPVSIKKGSIGNRTYTANWSLIDYNITYNNVSGCTFATTNPTNYNIESDEITLSKPTKANDTFTGWTYEGQTTPLLEVKIPKGSTGDKIFNANWEAYAVVCLKSVATDFPIDGQIQLEFDKDIAWQDSYKANITITPTTTTTPITTNSISYSNKILTLTLTENLKYSSQYQIAVAGIENICDNNMTFTTVAWAVTPQISSQTSDITKVNGVDRLVLQPTFTIDYGKKVLNQTVAKNNIKFNDAALPNSCNIVFDEDGKIATLTFTANLNVFSDYTLSLEGFVDDDNASINAQNLSFKTVPPEDITGEGTLSSPYLIYTQAHLNKLRDNAYLKNGKYFKQMDNIVMTGDWTPIGSDFNPFSGFYDGNNLKITGLTIQTNNNYAGLFSAIGSDNKSKIENLKLENVNINGKNYVGALSGYINNADITNVHVIGEKISIIGDYQYIGGLAGECRGVNIASCSVDSPNGLVYGGDTGFDIGGLIGFTTTSQSTISGSFVSAKIQGNRYVGGLVGNMEYCDVKNSYSDSNLTVLGVNSSYIGGLIGTMDKNNSSFNNCYAKIAYGSGSDRYGNCLAGYVDEDAQHPFGNSKNNFAWRAELPNGNTGTKTLYSYGDAICGDGLDYERRNYYSNGYPSSDITEGYWDAWDSEIWDNLTPGNYPKLKWQK